MQHFITALQHISPEIILAIEVAMCALLILILVRLQGVLGLYLFGTIGIIASNILVLKLTKFSFYDWPVGLGTGVFCMVLICNDIINEYYGKVAALKGVMAGFLGYLTFTVLMIIGLGFTPATQSSGIQQSFNAVFIPAPAILVSSLAAYLVSQSSDVFIFRFLRWITQGKWLWLRTIGSTALSSFIDNLIFSLLVWHYFADQPKSLVEVWRSYVLGFYGLRLALSIAATPLIYWAKWCIPKGHDKALS
jgi:uncharacterized integral membrane protein (TIGR00697 family)